MVLWFPCKFCFLMLHYHREGRQCVNQNFARHCADCGKKVVIMQLELAPFCAKYDLKSSDQGKPSPRTACKIDLKQRENIVKMLQVRKSPAAPIFFLRARRITGSIADDTSRSSAFYLLTITSLNAKIKYGYLIFPQ